MNDRKTLQAAIRAVAANLTNAAEDVARVLNSVAASLETSAAEDGEASAPAPRPKPGGQPRRSAPAGAAKTRAKRAAPAGPVTDRTVAAAMAELGPATSAQIAEHINQAAGRRVVDGRAIRGHARRLGARVVVRRGERLYRLA
jgi:hypothetical protein